MNENGFKNIIVCGFESDLWSELRGNYFREVCVSKYGKYLTLEEEIEKFSTDVSKKVSIYFENVNDLNRILEIMNIEIK